MTTTDGEMTDEAPVTSDNFPRAETDMYLARFWQGRVGVQGRFQVDICDHPGA